MTDEIIVSMLKENKSLAWEILYDKYGATMYGLICNLTSDKVFGEDIFISTFVGLKEERTLSNITCSLFMDLMRYTYLAAVSRLNQRHKDQPELLESISIMHFLGRECKSIKEIAYILDLSEKQAKINFRVESLQLRKYKNSKLYNNF